MDALTHWIVPLLVLLAVGVRPVRALVVSPLAVLPDLDVLVPPHRVVFHNVFALVAVAALVFAVARWIRAEGAAEWAGLAAFAFGSHLVLDVPTGVAVVWPLTDAALFVSVQVFWDSVAHAVLPVVEAGWAPRPAQPGEAITWLTQPSLTRLTAVAPWSVLVVTVLLPVAWAGFHASASGWRARWVARIRGVLPQPVEVRS